MEANKDKKVKAAPAANTPLRRVAQDKSCVPNNPRYFVWYAFLADPANKHASAPRKLILIFAVPRLYQFSIPHQEEEEINFSPQKSSNYH